jgi:hypothetical protein
MELYGFCPATASISVGDPELAVYSSEIVIRNPGIEGIKV